jgi:hypothetical protein
MIRRRRDGCDFCESRKQITRTFSGLFLTPFVERLEKLNEWKIKHTATYKTLKTHLNLLNCVERHWKVRNKISINNTSNTISFSEGDKETINIFELKPDSIWNNFKQTISARVRSRKRREFMILLSDETNNDCMFFLYYYIQQH